MLGQMIYFIYLFLVCEGIQCVDDIWGNENCTLKPAKVGEWVILTSKILDDSRHLLEDDMDVTHHGQCVGFYKGGEIYLASIL